MNLEIQNPELVQRVNAHIQTGQFHNTDELIEKAPAPIAPCGSLHEFIMNAPLRGANLDLERAKDYPRDVDFG